MKQEKIYWTFLEDFSVKKSKTQKVSMLTLNQKISFGLSSSKIFRILYYLILSVLIYKLFKYFNIPTMIAGHFTQVVWKSTKYVGMGIAKSNTHGSVVIVANYLPPGNFIGQFKTNVLRPRVK